MAAVGVAATTTWQPLMGFLLIATVVVGHRAQGLAGRRQRDQRVAAAVPAAVEVVGIVASGGGSIERALSAAARLDGPVGASMGRAASRVRLGLDPDPADPWTGSMFAVIGSARRSGASVGPALAAYARALEDEQHALALERAERMSVRLLVPLALLILPGFVVMTIGPGVVNALARLSL